MNIIDELLAAPKLDLYDLFDLSLSENIEGLYLEFGVWHGTTINYIASKLRKKNIKVYGFDSFKGLPQAWNNCPQGTFAFEPHQGLPFFLPNVELVIGYFGKTMDGFLATHPENCAFVHVDCDIYQSTKVVLTKIAPRLKKGTIIQFDELYNYPTYEQHEMRALTELVKNTNLQFKFIGRAEEAAAIIIT